ncbi:MAG: hypothetical protein HYR63_20520 [Proteobacteria bacterium]|nr:hypothetical protein [Pseudomonadota bacterium]MBI3497140.1 hypothetical protein [Pseudomonadota bacterium]
MSEHRYKVGQVVDARTLVRGVVPPGRYEVVRRLPAQEGDNQYRVKSVRDGHERVVRESELT